MPPMMLPITPRTMVRPIWVPMARRTLVPMLVAAFISSEGFSSEVLEMSGVVTAALVCRSS